MKTTRSSTILGLLAASILLLAQIACAQTYAVYGIIDSFVGGTDADGDGFYETYTFNVGVDADATPGPTTVYAKVICNTTGQSWWSSTSWTVTGTATDYHYFSFSQSDFAGYVTGNTSLDFTVEIWNSTKSTKLATDTTINGEPVKADYIAQTTYAVYGTIDSFVGGTDADGDGFYETYTFNIGVDADAAPGPSTIYAKMICNTTGQSWWSSSSWSVTGSETDHHYFSFTQADFAGYVTGNTSLDFTVEIWNSTKTTLLASDSTVSGEPVKADYIQPTTYAVYGIIDSFAGGTDADGDGFYETYTFNIGVDADASPGPATIHAKMICPTTGQTWWSSTSWSVTGSATDYHYFSFSQADFAGYISGNTSLDFTVELWNSTKTTLLASDTTVSGEPVKADYVPPTTYAVYGIINSFAGSADQDGDDYYENFTFNIGVDADASPGPATVYAKMICPTTGQTWWSSTSLTVTGIAVDYQYFSFSQSDFAGHLSPNLNLDFTVELWNSTKTTLIPSDTTVSGEPVHADALTDDGPRIGTGTGLLGDAKNHIDTYYDTFLVNEYELKDVSRRASMNVHGHNGQMFASAVIQTEKPGLLSDDVMEDSDDVWNASDQRSGVDAQVYGVASVSVRSRQKLGAGANHPLQAAARVCR